MRKYSGLLLTVLLLSFVIVLTASSAMAAPVSIDDLTVTTGPGNLNSWDIDDWDGVYSETGPFMAIQDAQNNGGSNSDAYDHA